MSTFINYLIEANLGLCLFLLLYVVFLKNETDFKTKRAFLLVAVVSSIILPLIQLNTNSAVVPSLMEIIPATWLPEFVVTGSSSETSFQWDAWLVIQLIYVTGILINLILFLIQLGSLLRVLYKSNYLQRGQYVIIESTAHKSSFSFFQFIFIGQADELSSQDKEQIIAHELVHARQKHSFDILLIQILGIFFWFNPLIKIYRKIFVQLHEFEADARAVENRDVNNYCSLLAKVALLSADIKIANHFSNSLTLKRIEMMRTIKSKIGSWKIAVLAFALPALFIIVSCQDQVKVSEPNAAKQTGEVFTTVEESASPAGGIESLGAFLSDNIEYPAESRKAGKEGTVFVEFVVNTDGSLSDFKTLKSVDPDIDAEALRVAKLLPTWNPGKQAGKVVRQRFVLPITFKLQ